MARKTSYQHARNTDTRSHNGWGDRSRARRELSQNFLSRQVAQRFADDARPAPDALVLEVGAGRGALTAVLAPYCRALVAYEIDPYHADALRSRFAGRAGAHVTVVCGDFLTARPPREPFAVYGNVPFSRTSDVVGWCLGAPRLTEATLVTQWEYARKHTGGYGRWPRLTVRTWPRFEWVLLGRIPRTGFRPVPRVDAGVLRIICRPRPLLPAAALPGYERLVDIGFVGKGGSLHASLRPHVPRPRLDRAFAAASISRTSVVGHIAPAQWLRVARVLLNC